MLILCSTPVLSNAFHAYSSQLGLFEKSWWNKLERVKSVKARLNGNLAVTNTVATVPPPDLQMHLGLVRN